MVNRTKHLMLIAILLISTTGCVRSLPTISHAHLGHALTAWHDTPGNQGLFEILESEANNAMEELQAAKNESATLCEAKEHVNNIVHSLLPEHQPDGNGLGYGVIPALKKSMQHLEFAATTDDVSSNVVQTQKTFDQNASANYDQFLITLAQARLMAKSIPSKVKDQLPLLEELLNHAIYGKDLDKDGVTGNLPEEIGLTQLRSQIDDMIKNEIDPTYRPIQKSYLLGLVRLPDGSWKFKL